MRKLSIGEVTFRKVGDSWRHTIMGDARVKLLVSFYQGGDLGNYEAVTFAPHHELDGRNVRRDQINWATSNIPEIADGVEPEPRTW